MDTANTESATVLPADSLVPLESVLCTEELNRRPTRAPDYEKENRALISLAQALADSPRSILQKLADTIVEVFQTDSAGISLLTKDGTRFYWPAIAGVWKPHLGGGTPRKFGPCGDVLDCNTPLMFRHLERRYTYFQAVTPPVEECLLVPFYVNGSAVGTIWAIAHDDRRKFDAEDMRQLVSLGRFTSSAYQTVAFLDALEGQDETLRQDQTELAQSMAGIQKANMQAEDSRRAALNLMEDAVRSAQDMEALNAELRQAEETLKELDRRKNEFLAMLAHELRNPLAPIRNALQIIRLTHGDAQALDSSTEMMERQVGHLVRMVEDLLDISRISRGKIELRRGRIELASAVNHAIEANRALYQSMHHELTVTLPPHPIYLNADPTRLAQVVGNLLNNACKFTDQGGRISLTVDREGEQAVIRVRDSGIGIAADQLPRIFDMFTQVDTSLERSVSGLGIGLSLVKNLVELHGGTVEVQSGGVGHGTEFVVRLPVFIQTAKPAPEPAISEPVPMTARRILVVDDNRDSATSLAKLLKLTGHETHTAYDGLEAVEAARSLLPQVVLLDIGLPLLNGYEACRRIRGEPWGKGMVLVALTGWGQEDDRQKSKEAGFNAHLVKPVEIPALMTVLAESRQPIV